MPEDTNIYEEEEEEEEEGRKEGEEEREKVEEGNPCTNCTYLPYKGVESCDASIS